MRIQPLHLHIESKIVDKIDTQMPKTGIILMTYGSATTAPHVREYFKSIYGTMAGGASEELIADFEHRYRLVGKSPLVEITVEQARLLEEMFTGMGDADGGYIVRAGMRHSAPRIAEAVEECRALGATRLIGIILSPQFSSVIMDSYRKTFFEAAQKSGFTVHTNPDMPTAILAAPWPTESHFIDLLVERIKTSLHTLSHGETSAGVSVSIPIPIVFTTHSLPQSVIDKDPSYLTQLTATIDAIRAKLGPIAIPEWYAAYQSAGHTPAQWLKPDLTDILQKLADKKSPAVLIVPIQFLSDHLEILYDLDIAARAQCEEKGIAYHRIDLPNTDPLFIAALASVAKRAEASF